MTREILNQKFDLDTLSGAKETLMQVESWDVDLGSWKNHKVCMHVKNRNVWMRPKISIFSSLTSADVDEESVFDAPAET